MQRLNFPSLLTLRSLARFAAGVALAIGCLVAQAPAAQAQETYFISNGSTWSSNGQWWYQGFTVYSRTTFYLRFSSDYAADAAIVQGSQLANFTSNRGFSGYAVLDNRFGAVPVTLNPGTYYVGARNQVNVTNSWMLELDTALSLPSSQATFAGTVASGARVVGARGGWFTQTFTIQPGFRYFVDGNNSGMSCYLIPPSETKNFTKGRAFRYYTGFGGEDKANPGLWELRLAPGTYVLAFRNYSSIGRNMNFILEAWRNRTRVPTRQGEAAAGISDGPSAAEAVEPAAQGGDVESSGGGNGGSRAIRETASPTGVGTASPAVPGAAGELSAAGAEAAPVGAPVLRVLDRFGRVLNLE